MENARCYPLYVDYSVSDYIEYGKFCVANKSDQVYR